MICRYCGKENSEEATICNYCGAPLLFENEQNLDIKITPVPAEQAHSKVPTIKTEEKPLSLSQPSQPASGDGFRRFWVWFLAGCLLVICLIVACAVIFELILRLRDMTSYISPATVTPLWSPTPLDTIASPPTHVPTATKISTTMANPTPTFTPLPSFTATPNKINSTPGLLFFDDFSDPTSGWDIHNDSTYISEYYDGTYRILVNTDNSDAWANPDESIFEDVSIDVEATKTGGSDNNDYGIICRYNDIEHFYYGLISSDGYFVIMKAASDGKHPIGDATWEKNLSINKGSGTNHIRLDCIGDVLSLYVNDQLVGQQIDSDYSSGNVGLIAGTYSDPGTDIRFDNFRVTQP